MNAAILSQLDKLLKTGKSGLARAKILQTKLYQIPPEHRLAFARLGRRAGLPQVALKILNPIVRPTGRVSRAATPEEVAEYAAGLTGIGAASEALELLSSIEGTVPEAILFQAFAHFSHWNYAAAIPLLDKYCQDIRITEYQRLIGLVNLGSALVHEQLPRANEVLAQVVEAAKYQCHSLLEGNGWLFLAEMAIEAREWEEGERCLRQAEQIFRHSENLEPLFIRKWRAVLELNRTSDGRGVKAIAEVRKEASARNHWETIRACDYHLAVRLQRKDLATHLYFGTPFESFRANLRKGFGGGLDIPATYRWDLGPPAEGRAPYLIDLSSGKVGPKAKLKVGQALHRMLRIFTSDFYRPFRGAHIHSLLYPREYFNPDSSPQRVRQVINRLRRWMETKKVPLLVEEDNGQYVLRTAMEPIRLLVPAENMSVGSELWLDSLKRALAGKESFTAWEAAEAMGMNAWTIRVALKEAKRDGYLLMQGKGPSSRYQFLDKRGGRQAA